jgi:hypothetical protein
MVVSDDGSLSFLGCAVQDDGKLRSATGSLRPAEQQMPESTHPSLLRIDPTSRARRPWRCRLGA